MKNFLAVCLFMMFSSGIWAQTHTVGLLSYVPSKTMDGYLLIFPQNQGNAFLLNNCGEIVHAWIDSSSRPSNAIHLMEDGSVWMAKVNNGYSNAWINGGGGGQKFEHRDWDNNLLWSFYYSDSLKRAHHDFTVLPNGNIVFIAWERKLFTDCINAGRNPALMPDGEIWPDHLVEIQPVGTDSGIIVWEWHGWDHLIQDFDSTQSNYGIIADHPELININYINQSPGDDWMHFNSVDYNETLDQLVVSSPHLNEIWIIDHSTSMSEASGHNGGNSNRGGDLIYRWGNPIAYAQGDTTDRLLGFQHDIHWMDEELPLNDPNRKKLMLFNNRSVPGVSTVNIIAPVFDTIMHQYEMFNNKYLPLGFDLTYTTPDPLTIFSPIVSSAQKLPNGNLLICSGWRGSTLEVDTMNEIVWQYKTPLFGGNPVNQGTVLLPSQNLTFKTKKYSSSWPGFSGHSLTSGGYIELNPDTGFCSNILSLTSENEIELHAFPNPTSDWVYISGLSETLFHSVQLTDAFGRDLKSIEYSFNGTLKVQTGHLATGIYFLNIYSEEEYYRVKIMRN